MHFGIGVGHWPAGVRIFPGTRSGRDVSTDQRNTTALVLALAASLGCDPDQVAPAGRAGDASAAPARTVAVAPPDTFGVPSLDQLSRLASQRWTFDLDRMVARRAIRVLVVPRSMLYFVDRGVQRGTAYEAVQEFERTLNRKLGTVRPGSTPIDDFRTSRRSPPGRSAARPWIT